MNREQSLRSKILNLSDLKDQVATWKAQQQKIVFTNGCFDLLHAGHVSSLEEAAMQGDKLIVGVNADASVKTLKGPERPLNPQYARALVLAALQMVDAVIIFEEATPRELIVNIMPDVLVKGGDYKIEDIAGAREVIEAGGRVHINPIVQGFSTTSLINKLHHSR